MKDINICYKGQSNYLNNSNKDCDWLICVHEIKLPIVNQEHVIYEFQCDLCDASYVGYTLRHLHQPVAERTKQSSSIGKHFINKHCISGKTCTVVFPFSGNA